MHILADAAWLCSSRVTWKTHGNSRDEESQKHSERSRRIESIEKEKQKQKEKR